MASKKIYISKLNLKKINMSLFSDPTCCVATGDVHIKTFDFDYNLRKFYEFCISILNKSYYFDLLTL